MATANATRRIRVKAPRPTLQQAIILALSDLPPAKCKPVRMDNGVPVYRFKKQIIRCGNFTTADGQPFEVTPKTLKLWLSDWHSMKSHGVPVPVPNRHDATGADENHGFVTDMASNTYFFAANSLGWSLLMSGTDVTSWQQFLTSRGVYSGAIDGVHGPASDRATRQYQTSRGLGADGVVGLVTYSQAVRDGFPGASPGMDACMNCAPFAASIAAAGMKFVARYYSRSHGKAMTRAEALALSQAGLQVAAVYQDVNNDIQYFSSVLGRQSAARALEQAAAVGQPAGSAIYFAADFDPTPAQLGGPMMDHFRAVGRAFSVAPTQYAVGVYGSGLACQTIRDAGLAAFTWLSGSTGFRGSESFRPMANLVQIAPSRTICGGQLSIDDDVAQTANFGAFQVK